MPTPNPPSCAVAFPRDSKNATDAESATGNATAIAPNARKPASIQELRAQLRAQLTRNHGGQPEIEKDAKLRTELRSCAVAFPRECNNATGDEPLPDPAMEARRQRVLAMLAERPDRRYAVTVDNPNADPVLVTIGIRDAATFELAIPAAKFNAFLLIDLIDLIGRRGAETMH